MIYELWYEDTSNIIGAYTAEDAALAEVRAFIEDYGPSSIERMILLASTSSGEKQMIAHGRQLTERATVAAPPYSSTVAT